MGLVAVPRAVASPVCAGIPGNGFIAVMGMLVTTDLGWVTGPNSANRTIERWGVASTDLGFMWDNGHDELCVVFGDSYNPPNPEGGAGGGDWRNNLVAFTTGTDTTDGLVLDEFVTDTEEHAVQVIPGNQDPQFPQETTCIPTGGCRVGARQYMAYMSVGVWGDPGEWTTNYAGLAYSDDAGRTWVKDDDAWWPNTDCQDQKFQVCTLVPCWGYVYIFGTRAGRRGPVYLARVPQDEMLNLDAHEQWLGWGWGKDPDNAVPIVSGEVSETSVAWHEPTRMWLMSHLIDRERRIVVRAAPNLLGPWSPPVTMCTEGTFPQLYGGFWHPWTMDRMNPCFVVSQWGPYNTRLVQVDLSGVPALGKKG